MLPISDYKNKQNKRPLLLKGNTKVKVVLASVLLLVSMVSTQLVFANNLATDGEKISSIQQEILRIENENTTLKAEIAKTSSLTNLSHKAPEMGFKKPDKLTILK